MHGLVLSHLTASFTSKINAQEEKCEIFNLVPNTKWFWIFFRCQFWNISKC